MSTTKRDGTADRDKKKKAHKIGEGERGSNRSGASPFADPKDSLKAEETRREMHPDRPEEKTRAGDVKRRGKSSKKEK